MHPELVCQSGVGGCACCCIGGDLGLSSRSGAPSCAKWKEGTELKLVHGAWVEMLVGRNCLHSLTAIYSSLTWSTAGCFWSAASSLRRSSSTAVAASSQSTCPAWWGGMAGLAILLCQILTWHLLRRAIVIEAQPSGTPSQEISEKSEKSASLKFNSENGSYSMWHSLLMPRSSQAASLLCQSLGWYIVPHLVTIFIYSLFNLFITKSCKKVCKNLVDPSKINKSIKGVSWVDLTALMICKQESWGSGRGQGVSSILFF